MSVESRGDQLFTAEEMIVDESENAIEPLANAVIARAFIQRASDVHIEPTEDAYIIRIRVDGQLEQFAALSKNVGAALVSRYKVMARLNIVERRRPQDGQFSVESDGKGIDVRLSTVATLFGEKAEMRLLDTRRELGGTSELGMSARDRARFEKLIRAQHGLLVTAGPTGAGKTTTLHSALAILNSPKRNVVTIEDPVEYVMAGVNHLPVNEEIGVTFAVQLRAILRQDPDTILVGETRDSETARISIQAALAGRLVLTSLHATDVVAAVYRFFQMEIEPHLIAASLGGVIAQRLVRRVCELCKEEYEADDSERVLLGEHGYSSLRLVRGTGCSNCRGSGYYGRIGVYQILEITEELREAISQRPEPRQLKTLVAQQGVRTLPEEAYDLARQGLTTIQEAALLAGVDV